MVKRMNRSTNAWQWLLADQHNIKKCCGQDKPVHYEAQAAQPAVRSSKKGSGSCAIASIRPLRNSQASTTKDGRQQTANAFDTLATGFACGSHAASLLRHLPFAKGPDDLHAGSNRQRQIATSPLHCLIALLTYGYSAACLLATRCSKWLCTALCSVKRRPARPL